MNAADALYYYVKSDFAERLVACTPDPDDDDAVQQHHATYNAKVAAELWNQQSRGLPLIYRGETPLDFEGFCDLESTAKPAIFIEFREGCRCPGNPLSSSCPDSQCRGAWGTVFRETGCDDAVRLVVWGDPTKSGVCTSANAFAWRLDSINHGGGQLSLLRSLVHELGHALNLVILPPSRR